MANDGGDVVLQTMRLCVLPKKEEEKTQQQQQQLYPSSLLSTWFSSLFWLGNVDIGAGRSA